MKLPTLQSIASSFAVTKPFRQKRILFPVIGLALAASVVVGRERPSQAVIAPAARVDTRLQATEVDIDVSKLARQAEETQLDPAQNPFARRSFGPAPGPQSAAAAAGASAPPLPFVYLGKVIEDGELAVFLSRGEKSYSVHAGQKQGQKLDNEYRIDKVTENSVTFTYLPSKTRQTLDIPAVNP
jgi:hypothetical protein